MKQHINKNFISKNSSQMPYVTYQIIRKYLLYKHAWKDGRSLASSFKLPIWVLYYRDPITFCTSIIESLEDNRSLFIFSVMEKSKQNFPVTHTV